MIWIFLEFALMAAALITIAFILWGHERRLDNHEARLTNLNVMQAVVDGLIQRQPKRDSKTGRFTK